MIYGPIRVHICFLLTGGQLGGWRRRAPTHANPGSNVTIDLFEKEANNTQVQNMQKCKHAKLPNCKIANNTEVQNMHNCKIAN